MTHFSTWALKTLLTGQARLNSDFLAWKLRHPMGRFSDYYAGRIRRQISQRRAHATLGPELADEKRYEESGRIAFEFLAKNAGISPDDICVEYGCGSLRVGAHFIRHLEPARYVGLDVVEDFFQAGLERLEPSLVKEKRPLLEAIQPQRLFEIGDLRPKLVFSIAVLQHVPPFEVRTFFENLQRLGRRGAVCCASFNRADRVRQENQRGWAYSEPTLAEFAGRAGFARVDFMEYPREHARPGTDPRLVWMQQR